MATLVERVTSVLLKPTTVWDEVDGEPATVQSLFMGYAAVLAAIPAILGLVISLLFGLLLHTYGSVLFGALSAIVTAILGYVLGLAITYALGFIISALASSFGSSPNQVQAMKVAVYSATPSWVAGIFVIIPLLGLLVIIAGWVYSYVLLFLGVPKIMKPPADKAPIYSIVAIAVSFGLTIVAFIVESIIGTSIAAMGIAATPIAIH
jgi:hypothetical protein